MKTKLLALGVCGLALALAGCVSTLDGRHTAAVPLVSDTVEARYERPLDDVWTAAIDTLTYNGIIKVANITTHTLEAVVNTRHVWLHLDPLPPNMTRLVVQVRTKLGGADKGLASDLDKQVAIRLASGNLTPATAPARPAAKSR